MTYKPKDFYRKNIKTWPNDIMHDIHQVTRIPGSNFCSSELVGSCYFSYNTFQLITEIPGTNVCSSELVAFCYFGYGTKSS